MQNNNCILATWIRLGIGIMKSEQRDMFKNMGAVLAKIRIFKNSKNQFFCYIFINF